MCCVCVLKNFEFSPVYELVTAPDPEPLYCGWMTYNTLLRIGLTLISIFVVVLCFVASIIKKHRVASWLVHIRYSLPFFLSYKNERTNSYILYKRKHKCKKDVQIYSNTFSQQKQNLFSVGWWEWLPEDVSSLFLFEIRCPSQRVRSGVTMYVYCYTMMWTSYKIS
jgi:hypothetical protein